MYLLLYMVESPLCVCVLYIEIVEDIPIFLIHLNINWVVRNLRDLGNISQLLLLMAILL